MRWSDFFGFVGMDADGGVDPVMGFRIGDGGVELFRARAYADGEKGVDAGRAGAFEHGVAVFRELREIDVGVGVDEVHGNRRNVERLDAKTSSNLESCGHGAAAMLRPYKCSDYFRRAPTSTSSWKPARTGRPSGPTEAAMIMPLDSTPRSLRGARLTTTATLRPIRASGS